MFTGVCGAFMGKSEYGDFKGPVWLLNVNVGFDHVLYFNKKTVIYKKKLIGLQDIQKLTYM